MDYEPFESKEVREGDCQHCMYFEQCAASAGSVSGAEACLLEVQRRQLTFALDGSEKAAVPAAAAVAVPPVVSVETAPVKPEVEKGVGSLTPSQIRVVTERRGILRAALNHLTPACEGGSGMSQHAVAKLLGVSGAHLCRLLQLAPKAPREPKLRPHVACKRALELPDNRLCGDHEPEETEWDVLLKVPAIQQELWSLYLATCRGSSESATHGRYTGSMAGACRQLGYNPLVPAHLAGQLRAGCKPTALLRLIRLRITQAMEQRGRGQRHYQNHGPYGSRDKCLRLPNGMRADLPGGYRWTLDDMSVNQPFYWDVMEGSRVVDTILSRQGLYCMDDRWMRWLGFDLVARPREAYRAEDILRFLAKLMGTFGKPDELCLEQGVWRARIVEGYSQDVDGRWMAAKLERPGMSDEDKAELVDGLKEIGVKLTYVYGPHSKIIESGFSHLQKVLAMNTRDFVNIGAHAGEREQAAKVLRQVRAGSRHPRDVRFVPMVTMAERILLTCGQVNSWVKQGETLSPDQGFAVDIQQRPLPALGAQDWVAFMPSRRERVIRGGAIHFPAGIIETPFAFRAGREFAQLGDGYRVLVRFDECNPAAGAAILNNEPVDSPRNNHLGQAGRRYQLGQFICRAEFEMAGPWKDVTSAPRGVHFVPVEDYYQVEAEDIGAAELRAQKKYHHTEGRILPLPGKEAVKSSATRDGRGNVLESGEVAQPAGKKEAATVVDRTPKQVRRTATEILLQRRSETPTPATDFADF